MENKNIDMKIVAELAGRYKNTILNLLIVLTALVVSFKIYQAQQLKVESLIRQKAAELQKNEVLDQINLTEKKYNEFKDYLNNKEVSSIIGSLGSMAAESSVEITSVKPGAQEALPVYIKYPYSLNLKAKDYHALGKFIAKVESNPDVYIIKSLVIRPDRTASDTGKLKISAALDLYTILVKK